LHGGGKGAVTLEEPAQHIGQELRVEVLQGGRPRLAEDNTHLPIELHRAVNPQEKGGNRPQQEKTKPRREQDEPQVFSQHEGEKEYGGVKLERDRKSEQESREDAISPLIEHETAQQGQHDEKGDLPPAEVVNDGKGSQHQKEVDEGKAGRTRSLPEEPAPHPGQPGHTCRLDRQPQTKGKGKRDGGEGDEQ
jgi:hypothetical protein